MLPKDRLLHELKQTQSSPSGKGVASLGRVPETSQLQLKSGWPLPIEQRRKNPQVGQQVLQKLSPGWEQPTGQRYPGMRRESLAREMLLIKVSRQKQGRENGGFPSLFSGSTGTAFTPEGGGQ